MANKGWKDVALILWNGVDLQSFGVEEVALPGVKAVLEEFAFAGNTWPDAKDTGSRRTKQNLRLAGVFDDTATTGPDDLVNALPQDGYFAVGVEGNVVGAGVWVGTVDAAGHGKTPAPEKITRYEVEGMVDGQLYYGDLIGILASRSAASNTDATSYDNGAASTSGGFVWLHVTALSLGGYTDLVGTLRHSTDNVTFAVKSTMTAKTAAPGSDRQTVAGTINRYASFGWAYSGAGAGPTNSAALILLRS